MRSPCCARATRRTRGSKRMARATRAKSFSLSPVTSTRNGSPTRTVWGALNPTNTGWARPESLARRTDKAVSVVAFDAESVTGADAGGGDIGTRSVLFAPALSAMTRPEASFVAARSRMLEAEVIALDVEAVGASRTAPGPGRSVSRRTANHATAADKASPSATNITRRLGFLIDLSAIRFSRITRLRLVPDVKVLTCTICAFYILCNDVLSSRTTARKRHCTTCQQHPSSTQPASVQ